MSTDFVGKATDASMLALANVSSSTDATPIEVTTGAAHGFGEGELVEVVGHETNLNANSTWEIHVVSATKFTLIGSTATGAGAGGATGTARSLTPRPVTAVPDGSDPRAAATWSAPYEALSSKVAYLAARTHTTIQQMAGAINDDETYASWSAGTTGGAGVWTEDTNFSAAPPTANVTAGSADTVEVYFQTGIVVGGAAIAFALYYQLVDFGVAPAFASASKILGSDFQLPASYAGPLVMKGRKAISGFTRGKKFVPFLAAMDPVGGKTYNLMGSAEILLTVYRNLQP